jgi:hypothetical protein
MAEENDNKKEKVEDNIKTKIIKLLSDTLHM